MQKKRAVITTQVFFFPPNLTNSWSFVSVLELESVVSVPTRTGVL